MHVTYLSIDSVQEGVGQSQILPLILAMSKKGLKIRLVSFEKKQPEHELINKLSNANVEWRILNFKYGFFSKFTRLLLLIRNIGKTDVIHARSDVPALAAIFSCKAPVLWDFRSLWFQQREIMAKTFIERVFFKKFSFIEKFISRRVNAISTLTFEVYDLLKGKGFRLPAHRIVVSTNVDLDFFKLSEVIQKPYRALYSGTYNSNYDLQTSFNFIKNFKKAYPISTTWAKPKETNRNSLQAGEDNIVEIDRKAISELIGSHSFGLSICIQDPGNSLKAAMPTKIAEFFAVGRPVVVSSGIGDLDDLITRYKTGVIIPDGCVDFIPHVQRLKELLEDKETPFRCRKLAEEHFNFDKGIEQYIEIYIRISRN